MTFKQKHLALNIFLLFVCCTSDRSPSSGQPPFYLLAKTVNLNICTSCMLRPQVILFNVRQKQRTGRVQVVQTEFSHVSDAPPFCPSTFLSAPAKCKNRARASTSSITIQRACTYTCFFVPDIGKTLFAMKCSFALGSNQI